MTMDALVMDACPLTLLQRNYLQDVKAQPSPVRYRLAGSTMSYAEEQGGAVPVGACAPRIQTQGTSAHRAGILPAVTLC